MVKITPESKICIFVGMNEKLPKALKLKSKKLIKELFSEGNSTKAFPIILISKKENSIQTPFKVGFSVSKRHFKHAVDRNKIKRLMREYFRKNKYLFDPQKNDSLLLMFLYVGKTPPNYKIIETTMQKLSKKYKKTF